MSASMNCTAPSRGANHSTLIFIVYRLQFLIGLFDFTFEVLLEVGKSLGKFGIREGEHLYGKYACILRGIDTYGGYGYAGRHLHDG